MRCKECGIAERNDIDPNVISWTCGLCVAKKCPFDEKITVKEKRPRGWHRKELYVSPSGVEYNYGKEIKNGKTEQLSTEVSGTGNPTTPPAKRKKRTKRSK